jgi:hypothetical protein
MPLREMLDRRYVNRIEVEVVVTSAERGVVVIQLATPLPDDAQDLLDSADIMLSDDERPQVAPPAALFRLLAQALFARDLDWLSAIPVDEQRELLEALAAATDE